MTDERVNAPAIDPDTTGPEDPAEWLQAWPEACVVGQVGQSLDGRVATPTGHSHYINGLPSRVFLHRLRAAVDAVVIGAGTALADDPRLTVRHCQGCDPVRVIIDPNVRVMPDNAVFGDDGIDVIHVVSPDTPTHAWPSHVQRLALAMDASGLDPRALLDALRARSLNRVLVEGGPKTLSGFIQARALDRLYLMIAPLIIGSGPTGLAMPDIAHLDQALRVPMRSTRLDDELLVELNFVMQRD